jgi:uncharacterized membrane protein YeiH
VTPNRLFWTKASIGISSIVIFIAGIAVKALWPEEIAPVVSDINALMILSSGIFGGLIRDVLGFKVPEVPSPSVPSSSSSEAKP